MILNNVIKTYRYCWPIFNFSTNRNASICLMAMNLKFIHITTFIGCAYVLFQLYDEIKNKIRSEINKRLNTQSAALYYYSIM